MLPIGKIRQMLKQERGQSLVEMALLLMFVAAVVLAINWDGLRDSAGGAYQKMASSMETKESRTRMVEGYTGNYAEKAARYKSMSTEELRQTDNAERIAMDRKLLTEVGQNFLGLSKDDIKTLFATTSDNLLTGKDNSKPYGVAVFDYNIVNPGDNGEDLNIKLRGNAAGSVSNKQAIQWMQGNFDTNTQNYNKKDEYVSTRYFFSNDAIDPKPNPNVSGEQSATVRAFFSFDSNDKVDQVTINVTRSYQNSAGAWVRTLCEGLSKIIIKN